MILDTIIYLAAVNAVCAGFDGAAFLNNREYPGFNEIITVEETGPARLVVGPHPTYGSFLLAGLGEIIVMSAISYGLKRAGLKRYWWAPQLSVSFYHGYLGFMNIKTGRELERYGRERGYYD